MSLSRWLLLPFFAMLIIGVVMPSDGSHGLMSPKGLSFASSSMFFCFYFFLKQKVNARQLMLVSFFLIAMSFLLIWLLIGIDHSDFGMGSALDQMKLFILTIATTLLALYLVSEGLTTGQKILRTVIIANFIYFSCKVLLVALHVLGIVNMFSLLHVSGFRFMTMGIIGTVSRLQTSVDVITPFLLYFVLQSNKLDLRFSRTFRAAFVIMSLFSIFLSFSRFLMFVAFAAFVFYWLSQNLSKLLTLLVLSVAACFLMAALIGFGNVASIIEQRFFSSSNYYSDLAREEQIAALMGTYDDYSWYGKGLGGYVSSLIRDGDIMHSYEVQWVAFLMQFGIFGTLILLIPFGIIAYRLIFPTFTRIRFGLFNMFGLWIVAGFTNPFMISLGSGIVYTVFLLTADILKEKEESRLLEHP